MIMPKNGTSVAIKMTSVAVCETNGGGGLRKKYVTCRSCGTQFGWLLQSDDTPPISNRNTSCVILYDDIVNLSSGIAVAYIADTVVSQTFSNDTSRLFHSSS